MSSYKYTKLTDLACLVCCYNVQHHFSKKWAWLPIVCISLYILLLSDKMTYQQLQ